VKAEPGEHEIVFEYKPDCVKYGLILTFTGLGIFLLACIADLIVKKIRARKTEKAALPAPANDSIDDVTADNVSESSENVTENAEEETDDAPVADGTPAEVFPIPTESTESEDTAND